MYTFAPSKLSESFGVKGFNVYSYEYLERFGVICKTLFSDHWSNGFCCYIPFPGPIPLQITLKAWTRN